MFKYSELDLAFNNVKPKDRYFVVLLVSSRRPDNVSHFLSIILSLFPFLVIKLNVLSLS